MKTVFSSHRALAHEFANLSDSEKFTRNGRASSMFFRDGSIFSYGSHFTIAKYIRNESGEIAALLTERTYSVSTAKHIGLVWRALHGTILRVPNCDASPREFPALWEKEFKSTFDKFTRARAQKEWHLRTMRSIESDVKAYYAFTGSEIPASLSELFAVLETDETIKNSAEVFAQIAERTRLAEERQDAEHVAKWKSGETNECNTRDGLSYLRYNIESERVETSQHVKIGIYAARELWRQIRIAEITKDAAHLIGVRVLDSYVVKSLTLKHITIGCHKIPLTEVDEIAARFSWQIPQDILDAANDRLAALDAMISKDAETIQIRQSDGKRVDVQAYPVYIDGFSGLYVHHRWTTDGFDSDTWTVSERSTGLSVMSTSDRMAQTSRRVAVMTAKGILENAGAEKFAKMIADALEIQAENVTV